MDFIANTVGFYGELGAQKMGCGEFRRGMMIEK
mgnify:CR=1 FL=1|jgi:hypothetical protein